MNTDRIRISVVIPLYNKEREAARAVRSVLDQRYRPLEIIVVDDGSTDRSAAVVEELAAPEVRLIRQANAGVSAARNRGTEEASGDYVAFLDADDWWEPGFLEEIAALIGEFPGCGIYSTAFRIVRDGRRFPARQPQRRGVVADYFDEAMTRYVCLPSSSCLPRSVLLEAGGFPPGMKLGEDLYLWTKVAARHPVCFSPRPEVNYSVTASNRSSAIYTPERTEFSFRDLYTEGNDSLNEYIARCGIAKAITVAAKGDTRAGREAERFFRYTRRYRFGWRKLYLLNRLPRSWRPGVLALYNRLAWMIARKGL